jgi:hypothetical protein
MSSPSIARTALPTQPRPGPLERALQIFLGCATSARLTIEHRPPAAGTALPDMVILWSQGPDTATLLASEGHSHIYRFAVLPSRTRPRWILPYAVGRKGIDGFQFYMPYSRVARWVKAIVLQMRAAGWQGWVRDCVLIASRTPLPIETLVDEAVGERETVFALSIGTPGTYQKLTVQVMRKDGSVVGYLKMPLTGAAERRLQHEAEVLRTLHEFPKLKPHIPALFFAGRWHGNFTLFESVLPGETGPVQMTGMHDEFLRVLQRSEPRVSSGQSVIERTARKWECARPLLGAKWHGLANETLRIASRELGGSMVPSGLHHGDFTPWNTRVDRGTLRVFDWESAEYDAPILWDQFHFLAQAECVLKQRPQRRDHVNLRPGNRALYLLYLLSSASDAAQERSKQFAIDYREAQIVRHLSEMEPANP